MRKIPKDLLWAVVHDLVSDLLYYDRKEDEDLPVGAIEEMIESGYVSEAEIVSYFMLALHRGLT